MRAYFFVNANWLRPVQHGIQAKHCGDEIALKVLPGMLPGSADAEMFRMWHEWAQNHKTVIVLDGGAHGDLVEIAEFFRRKDNPYPSASFCEDEYSLNGAMTSVGIVLPEELYERARMVREDDLSNDTEDLRDPKDIWEAELIELLNSRSLAR